MNLKLSIAQFIRWHELKLAWKVFSRQYVLQHNLFAEEWKQFSMQYDHQSLQKLCSGLDSESKIAAEILVQRFSNPFSIYPALYPKQVFTKQEIDEQNEFRALRKDLCRKYHVRFSDLDPSPLMYKSGLRYVPAMIKERLKDSVILDIGAFVGQASVAFLDFQPSTVFSFEPSLKNFNTLKGNLKAYIEKNKVFPVNSAVGNERGEVFISDAGNSSSIKGDKSKGSGQKVVMCTVDDFVNEHAIDRIGLLKLDVEGFEMNVIRGALNTIKKYRPILLISIYHTPADFFTIKPLLEELNLGYKFLIRKTNPFWLTYDTMLICYAK